MENKNKETEKLKTHKLTTLMNLPTPKFEIALSEILSGKANYEEQKNKFFDFHIELLRAGRKPKNFLEQIQTTCCRSPENIKIHPACRSCIARQICDKKENNELR